MPVGAHNRTAPTFGGYWGANAKGPPAGSDGLAVK